MVCRVPGSGASVFPQLAERPRTQLLQQPLTFGASGPTDVDKYVANTLIGTPEQVCAKVAAFEEAGLDGFCATLFVANTVDEMLEQMRLFARYVIPAFPDRSADLLIAGH
jgi:alkanesulfonate monooxygenase SsuD/methylene tetrahydromethanopterin reductase-like flavin-dependent oxidoreductase (luciferase family)